MVADIVSEQVAGMRRNPQRLGRDVTFRLVGAALGFVVLMLVLYRLAPVFLTPDVAEEVGLR